MHFKIPHIDLFSFWFGFALATLFWLIILRISRLLPKMRKSLAASRERKTIEKSFTREHDLQKFMLRKAQSSHLAAAWFPLEKTVIESKFLARPVLESTEEEMESIPALYKAIPALPETPELLSDFPVLKYSFPDLLIHHQYISVAAHEGYGKTTALAWLTSQLLNESENSPQLPIFLDFRQINAAIESPLSAMAESISHEMNGLTIEILSRLISAAAAQKRLILLIDSLDELAQTELESAISWLKKLKAELPDAKIVVTSNPLFTGSLESAGFSIFTLASWGKAEHCQYLAMWKKAWQEYCKSLPQEQKVPAIERGERISFWLAKSDRTLCPLELSMQFLLAFTGAISENTSITLQNAYFNYLLSKNLSSKAIELVAEVAKNSPGYTFTGQQFIECLSTNSELVLLKKESYEENSESNETKAPELFDFAAELHTLLASGIFKPTGSDVYAFSHLTFLAAATRQTLPQNPIPPLVHLLANPVDQIRFEMLDTQEVDAVAFGRWLNTTDAPLYRNLIFSSRWLTNLSTVAPIHSDLLKRIVTIFQDRRIPIEIRFRLLSGLVFAKDPSIASLFGYLRSSPDAEIRGLSAMGYAALQDEKYLSYLVELAHDPSPDVQKIACIGLGNTWNTAAQDALADIIFSAEEPIREIACQVLAVHSPEGHQMLKEITETDNYFAKKAAISGLLMVKEDWVRPIFEKLSVEDTQWVVRDAAGFALEKINQIESLSPDKLLPVLENPWTLKKAEEMGFQLPASGFPYDFLFKLLDQGNSHDQTTALLYLLEQPNGKLVTWLIAQAKQNQTELTGEIVISLYQLARRGISLNEPV